MHNIFIVAMGGAAGASARYLVSVGALKWLGPGWPWATFTVNMLGSALMGILASWLIHKGDEGEQARLLLATGVLGGFTTFSAFSLEVANMIERKAVLSAAGYAIGSLVLGVAALFLGLLIARKVFAA